MCIRDSGVGVAARPGTLVGVAVLEVVELVGRAVREQVVRCLLYTSDAADERSSVDLGGRRIIKKKKSVVDNRTHSSM